MQRNALFGEEYQLWSLSPTSFFFVAAVEICCNGCDLTLVYSGPLGIKQSRNSPGVAQRDPGGSDSQISMTFGT